jgi:hypothetical protein
MRFDHAGIIGPEGCDLMRGRKSVSAEEVVELLKIFMKEFLFRIILGKMEDQFSDARRDFLVLVMRSDTKSENVLSMNPFGYEEISEE